MRFKFYMSFVFAIFMMTILACAQSESYLYDENEEFFYEDAASFPLVSYMPDVSGHAQLFSESIYDYLESCLMNMDAVINVSDFGIKNVKTFRQYFHDTLYMNPKLYYVDSGYMYSSNNKGIITKIKPKYIVTDKEEITTTQKKIDEAVEEYISYTDG